MFFKHFLKLFVVLVKCHYSYSNNFQIRKRKERKENSRKEKKRERKNGRKEV